MTYEQWQMDLFEEIYPRIPLLHGFLHFQKNTLDKIEIQWGNTKPFVVNITDFYTDDDCNTLDRILKWVYSSMPFIPDEADDSYLAYNFISQQWDLYCHRPFNILYPCRNVNPEAFKEYSTAEKCSQATRWTIGGTILSVSSTIKGLPATYAISNKKVFMENLDTYMDYSDNLSLLLPDSIETNQVFIGYEDAIQRLYGDFPKESSQLISLGQWFTLLNNQDKD